MEIFYPWMSSWLTLLKYPWDFLEIQKFQTTYEGMGFSSEDNEVHGWNT